MDQADVPAFLLRAAAWALAALVATLFLAYLAGALCRRAGLKGGIPALATLLTPVALLFSASLYFDSAGVVTEARVQTKEERIRMSTRGAFRHLWHRMLTMTVASGMGGAPTTVFVQEEDFDSLRVGSPVKVRLLPKLPWFGRLAHRNTWTSVPWAWLTGAGIALGAGFAAWLFLRRRARMLAPLGFFAAAWVWTLLTTFPSPWNSGAADGGESAVAEVRAVHRVDTSIGRLGSWSTDAEQPWDIVELQLTPNGGLGEPVVAIDDVDANSVPGLVNGARLPVRYPAGLPREARLLHGTRVYRRLEWENLLVLHAFAAALLAAGALLAKFRRRR